MVGWLLFVEGSCGIDPLGIGFVVERVGAWFQTVDDDHAAAAGRARKAEDPRVVVILERLVGLVWRRGVEQVSDAIEIGARWPLAAGPLKGSLL